MKPLPPLKFVGLMSVVLSLINLIVPPSAQAQHFSNLDSGLFHPRSSEQFFQEGLVQLETIVEQLEREIECLSDPEPCSIVPENILTIDQTIPPMPDPPPFPEEGLWPKLQTP